MGHRMPTQHRMKKIEVDQTLASMDLSHELLLEAVELGDIHEVRSDPRARDALTDLSGVRGRTGRHARAPTEHRRQGQGQG